MANTEVIKKWVAALRSGDYRQTEGWLHDENGYCCLGVLCDIAVKDGVIPSETTRVNSHGETITEYDGQSQLLPQSVSDWSGITHSEGGYVYIPCEDEDGDVTVCKGTLVEANDNYGATFAVIAALIEENYLSGISEGDATEVPQEGNHA